MSGILKVNNITTIAGKPLIKSVGANHIVNYNQVYFSDNQTFSAPISGNGVQIIPLTLTVSPLSADNILIMEWMITGEGTNNHMFLIHKNGSLITTVGEEGYNSESGNVLYSGIHAGWYDANEATTPSNHRLTYQCIAGSTSTMTFSPAVRSSFTTTEIFHLNRSVDNLDEKNSSFGFLWEFTPG